MTFCKCSFRFFGAVVVSLFLVGMVSAQPIYYEIQIDLFEDGELVVAPYVVVEAGKSGSVTFTNKAGRTMSVDILASYEGVVEGQATVRLALTVKREAGTSANAGTGDGLMRNSGPTVLMAPTVFVKSTEAISDPFTLSQGPVDIVASIRRVPLRETAAFVTSDEQAECASNAFKQTGEPGGVVSSGGSDCCSVDCPDGEGPLQCCDVPRCCCGDVGNCCKPQQKAGF